MRRRIGSWSLSETMKARRTNHTVVATDKHGQIQGAFVFFAASQPPARLCLVKMPRILFVSGFHPATRARDLAYEFERCAPPARRPPPRSAPADPAARRLQVRPARSLRRPRPPQPPRHPQSVSICPFAPTDRRAAAVLPAPARPSRRRLPPVATHARTHVAPVRIHAAARFSDFFDPERSTNTTAATLLLSSATRATPRMHTTTCKLASACPVPTAPLT